MLLGALHRSRELGIETLDLSILELCVALEAIDALGISTQRAHQLLLAVELRAHALELEILVANFVAQLARLPRPPP